MQTSYFRLFIIDCAVIIAIILYSGYVHRYHHSTTWAFLVAQMVKNLPAKQETRVWSLGREDLLEKEMATTPVFLPGVFHGQRSLEGSGQRVGHNWATNTFTFTQLHTLCVYLCVYVYPNTHTHSKCLINICWINND